MNCDSFIERLDAWLDGELSAADVGALEAHAMACADCKRELAGARRLQERALALPRAIEPPRELWTGIERRIATHGARRSHARTAFGALAAGVLLAAVFFGGMLADRAMQRETRVPMADASPRTVLPSTDEARRLLPASYVNLIEGAGPGRADGVEQDLLRHLMLVNLAIREVESAAAAQPSNSGLRELLAGLYAQENRILAQAERRHVERTSTPRTTI